MKPSSPQPCSNPAALLAGLLLIPAGLQASQLAYEGFDYPAGSGNVSGMAGGSGWNGTWLTVNNGSADVVTGSLSASGISPAGYDLRSIGNSVTLPNNRRIGRFLDTSVAGLFGTHGYRDANGRIGADGKTVYISFIQQPDGTANYYEFELHRGDLGDGGRIGGIGNDSPGDNVNLRAPNGTQTVIGPGSTTPNFYVIRIDYKAGNDDVYVYRNPTSATEPGAPTLTRLAAADMSFDGISFGAFNNSRIVSHDEVRLGETWADVTVPAAAIPVFTIQPKAATNAYAGSTVTLSAEASGQPAATYQWFKGTTALTGQTAASLTLTNVQTTDAATYKVTATNGSGTATSTNAVLTVQAAPAGLLAYEGFDYSTGNGNLPGKSAGIGWGAAWTNINGPGSAVQTGSLAAGTNSPNGYDAQSQGNSLYTGNGQRDGRFLDTTPAGRFGAAGYVDGSGNIGADGTTLYFSFLQQPDGATKFYEFELHRGDLGDPGRIGGVGNDTGNPTVALRTGGAQTLIGPGSTGVNLYVVRVDYKAGNDDVYVYQNPISATEPGTPSLFIPGASDMSFNGISLAAFDNGRTVKHDEIRIGKTWSDVMFGTSRRQLVWTGDGASNLWNFAALNWKNGATATAFSDGDPVTFDDTGSSSPAISIPSNVSTGSITATNATKNYTLGGAGTINCSGGLAKSGAGSLTLAGTANFGSTIEVAAGTLALSGTVSAGGGLSVDDGSAALSGTNSLGGLISTNGDISITGPTTITGAGALVWMGTAVPVDVVQADSAITIENGGSLTMSGSLADSWVVGRDGGNGTLTQNGGTITYNPTNRNEAFIGASIPTTTVAAYNMKGGTLEMSSKTLELALGPITSNLNQTGGTINVNQLFLGASLGSGPGTGIFTQTSGVMNIGAGGIITQSGLYEIDLGGGTIAATADWASQLDMALTGGVLTFDSATHAVDLTGALSGSGGLTKIGTGTLVLGGFSSYTGATTVSAGRLGGFGTAEGTTEGSAVTVAAGASLAPGDPSTGAVGIFETKSATFASGSTLEIDIDSSFVSADELMASGAINIGGVNATFQEVAGGVLPVGTSFVIVNAGTTLTGTFAGFPDGATFSAGANSFVIHYTAKQVTLTSVAGSAYSSWAAAHGLDATPGKDPAFSADPDGDGVINGLEWTLGGDPLVQDSTALYTVTGNASTGLTLSFNRLEASIAASTLTVQWSNNLTTWTDVPISQAGGSSPNGVTVTVNQTATPDAVSVLIPASNASGGHLFARLKATMP